jgi:hypothetical protein
LVSQFNENLFLFKDNQPIWGNWCISTI